MNGGGDVTASAVPFVIADPGVTLGRLVDNFTWKR
jgi:hypothetical protein